MTYADGTSGHQGDTSLRAEPSRRQRIEQVYNEVRRTGSYGRTWREVADDLGLHHGEASGALSNLHRTNRLVRLRQTRNRCGVYVVNDERFILERETVPHRSHRGRPSITYDELAQIVSRARGRQDLLDTLAERLGV